MCRLCGKSSETMIHISSGCSVLAESKYRIWHDIVGKDIHCLLLKKYWIYTRNNWYSHAPSIVTERERDNGKVTIYWDKPIKTDTKVSYDRPHVIDREKSTWYTMNFAISMDHHVKEKEEEKTDKYMDLAAEVRRQLRLKTVVIRNVLGALGTVPAKLSGSPEKLEIEDIIGNLQTAVLMSTAAIRRRVFNL